MTHTFDKKKRLENGLERKGPGRSKLSRKGPGEGQGTREKRAKGERRKSLSHREGGLTRGLGKSSGRGEN